MGEPLANDVAVWGTIERLHADVGMSARHLTVSTVGIVPGIRRLAERPLPVNLAVSLHAANDQLRDELVPINKRYPIAELSAACADYLRRRGRRLSFEWALIDGVNDRPSDAAELARVARNLPLHAHVNQIPLNPTPGWPAASWPQAASMSVPRLRRTVTFTPRSSSRWRNPSTRSGGRRHEGVDMIGSLGMALYAVTSGSVQFKQTPLGGNSAWVNGNNGNRYFYAHLDGFAGESRSVERGELIGYMGHTGNANGVNHLHFEVHPGGGSAVNPYPTVAAIC
jgi:murein DD-endopeptidase MepM/ murein hydrolase activator NlpD